MKRRLSYTLAVIAFSMSGLAALPADAATTAAGPYYATPSWDQQLPIPTRFIVLSNWVDANFPTGGAAVLDRETGLVWERSPDTTRYPWEDAHSHCNNLRVGQRLGWRLPAVQELATLFDPSLPTVDAGIKLPAGHPFMNVQSESYWSANTGATPDTAWSFFSRFASTNSNLQKGPNFQGALAWCVRGGPGVDAQ